MRDILPYPKLWVNKIHNLEMLRVNQEVLNLKELAQLSSLTPNLTRLGLEYLWNFQDPDLVLTFPHLRSLRLDAAYRNSTGRFPRFQCSSLQHLALGIPEPGFILSAIRQSPRQLSNSNCGARHTAGITLHQLFQKTFSSYFQR